MAGAALTAGEAGVRTRAAKASERRSTDDGRRRADDGQRRGTDDWRQTGPARAETRRAELLRRSTVPQRGGPRAALAQTAKGFTLLEVLIVVLLVGILASVVVPASRATSPQVLQSAAVTLAADLRYARNLAVERGADVVVRLDGRQNTYTVDWASGRSAGSELPLTVAVSGSTAEQQNAPVRLLAAVSAQTGQPVQAFTFHSSGGLGPERNEDVLVWLASGAGDQQRFVQVKVSWVTGLVWVGPVTNTVSFSGQSGQ